MDEGEVIALAEKYSKARNQEIGKDSVSDVHAAGYARDFGSVQRV